MAQGQPLLTQGEKPIPHWPAKLWCGSYACILAPERDPDCRPLMFFIFLVKIGFCYIAQADLELKDSSDLLPHPPEELGLQAGATTHNFSGLTFISMLKCQGLVLHIIPNFH